MFSQAFTQKPHCLHPDFLRLSEFRQTNYLLSPQKFYQWFSDDLWMNRSLLIHSTSLNIRSKIWQ